MGEIVGLILVISGSAASAAALLVLTIFLIPRRVNHTRQVIGVTPGRSFIIGLVNAIFFLVIAVIFAQGGEGGRLLALIILLALLALAAIGLAGMTLLLRERIYPDTTKAVTGLSASVKTAVLLVLAGLLPFIGWFVLTPILLLVGLGASIIVLLRRDGRQPSKTAEEESSLPY
jgi:hypothetical protein